MLCFCYQVMIHTDIYKGHESRVHRGIVFSKTAEVSVQAHKHVHTLPDHARGLLLVPRHFLRASASVMVIATWLAPALEAPKHAFILTALLSRGCVSRDGHEGKERL